MTPFSRRPNPVFTPEYEVVRAVLVAARRSAGLTQRGLAGCLGKAGSHVCMIETGQRRVDALELHQMAHCLGVEPTALFARISAGLQALSTERGRAVER